MQYVKIFIAIFGALTFQNSQAQSIERSTFDIAGGTAHTAEFEVHYSLGESFVKTIDLGDVIISEGFVQGSILAISTPIVLFPHITVGVSPNPSFDKIRISSDLMLPNSRVKIFSATGQLMIERSFEPNMEIHISQLPSGTYYLNWVNEQQLVRQFKVVKL